MKKFLLIVALIVAASGLLGVGGFIGLYFWAAKDLPGFKKITDYNPPLVTTVYARDNRILGYFYREKRFLVRLGDMPPHLAKAFLAAEDSAFYEHEGIDLTAIARAFTKNIQAGSIVQGGSTITQQIIKRLLLTSEKSYERKIKEAILAYRLERYLNKDEILTIYLNQIYLGARAYGVEAAARTYFGKHVGELTLAESALLAGLPQAPSKHNPLRSPESAKVRQRYVLEQLRSLNWISPEEYQQALAEPLFYTSMKDPSWKIGAYYLEEVRRWLIDYLSEENMARQGMTLPKYGEDAVYELGLHVRTAVDLDHQAAAEKAMKAGLEASTRRRGWRGPLMTLGLEERQTFLEEHPLPQKPLEQGDWLKVLVTKVDEGGATVMAGNSTGRMDVATMAWCREPDPSKAPEDVPKVKDARKVLKAGDVVWASLLEPMPVTTGGENPPVMALALAQKPLVQGALVSIEPPTGEVVALSGGYSFEESQFNRATQAHRQPGSAFKPIVYSTAIDNGFTPASIVLDAPVVFTDYNTDTVWRPENFEGVFYGPTLLRTALVKSRNLVTIRVAQRLGINKVIERALALGLEGEFLQNLSVSLGSVAVTPLNLCQAYTAFARGGSYVKPRMVLSLQSAWGEDIYTSEIEAVEAISPQTAYIITSLLKQVVQSGTGWRAKVLKRPVAGKTGTTNNEQDAWFLGTTPYLLTGVYVGFDQLTPMGKWETGSRAAAPIWVSYRKAVEKNYPLQDFPEPPGIVNVRVDAQTGLLAGSSSKKSYFLPFKTGTQPTRTAEAKGESGGDAAATGEELMKQIF